MILSAIDTNCRIRSARSCAGEGSLTHLLCSQGDSVIREDELGMVSEYGFDVALVIVGLI